MSFAKNLSSFGIKPIVFTLGKGSYSEIYPKIDITEYPEKIESMVSIELDEGTHISQNKLKRFGRIFFNNYRGSEHVYWKKNFYKTARELIKLNNIEAIFVTVPPFGMLELATNVSKEYNLPLIVDMRDAWLYWTSNPYGSIFHFLLTKKLEKKYFNDASAVISTSKETIEDWNRVHPELNDKYYYIPNGFEKEFVDLVPKRLRFKPSDKKIIISYFGSFYFNPSARNEMFRPWYKRKGHRKFQYTPRKQDWLYRSPYYIFKTFNFLFEVYPYLRSKIVLKFSGHKEEWFDKMVEEFQLNDVVRHDGFLPLQDSIKMQREADFLLLTSAKLLEGRDCFIAGKTFEYFHSGKPIMAFVAEGAQKDILKESGTSLIFDPDRYKQNAEKIEVILRNGVELDVNNEFVKSHNRFEQTKKLSKIINDAIQDSNENH